ncbi:MAG: NAD(P)/FAD-dependent oxidoreductase [Proteobacteria bacterium]|nr:NAD(P)/FAD-dependent oxidoreductase [Pseudomonadota bacterium]
MNTWDVIVIGAGAAGLFFAGHAAGRGRSVLVLDPGAKPARKVRISGGGRCNFTNLDMDAGRFVCGNPHFVKSALACFTPWDMVEFLGTHGLTYEEKALGQLFCAEGAGAVARALERFATGAGANLRLGEAAVEVQREEGAFGVTTGQGRYRANSLVVATGGPSWPGVGATWFGYDVARQFDLRVEPPRPALVPLVCGQWSYVDLAGLSLPVRVSCAETVIADDLLFTHKGLSGPAILRISMHWKKGEFLVLDLLPGLNMAALIDAARQETGKTLVRKLLARHFPSRLAERLGGQAGGLAVAELDREAMDSLVSRVHQWQVMPTRSEGWERAEVAAGGVDTRAFSSKTMEANGLPGLYFIGEVLDVTGELGGYNLHWAWASAHAAAQAV